MKTLFIRIRTWEKVSYVKNTVRKSRRWHQRKGLLRLRADATGKRRVHPRIFIISAFRVLAYDMACDQVDEICELSTSTSREAFMSFIGIVVSTFGAEYLRSPRKEDLMRIQLPRIHWLLGRSALDLEDLPCCLGRSGKEKRKKPTVVLEVIVGGNLWIWGCNFGTPGSINILDDSMLIDNIMQGRMLPELNYYYNCRERSLCYYLF